MAFFPGPPGFPGFNQIEANVQMSLLVQQLKSTAEMKLQSQDYQGAYDGYSRALEVACRCPITGDEIPKILCNRSMVLYKMRRYREALVDAVASIQDFPYWIKGYWRACQAEKEIGNLNRAVEVLVDGLNACAAYSATLDDQISLFTEMVMLLCQVRGLNVQRLQPPTLKSTKAKIILRLISNKAWEGVSYLVTGEYTGDNMDLAATFSDLNFDFAPVGNLLKETTRQQKINWGIELAVALLKKGASFQQMEFNYGQAAVHIGVQTALETGNVDLLKFLLSTYIDSKEKKDIIDKNGDTAIHVVVKSGISNSTLGETVLRLLMNSGCTAYLKDMSGKLPVDYLKPTDQGFTLLQTAKNNSEEEIRKKVIMFKEEGNNALKENNNGKAIQMYTKGLQLCGQNSAFKRDAALLLSNRSNVYSMMGMNREALKDAEESVKSDKTWYKGYWRKGQELKQLKRISEAYTTFLEMFRCCNDVNPGDKLNFLTEAAMLFKDIPDSEKREKYKLLVLGDDELWSNILNRMSKSADWLTIRYLLMGMSTTVSDDPNHRGFGVAAQAATNRMSFGTVFEFLKTVKNMKKTVDWLTPTLVVLLYKHAGNFLSLLEDDRDTCVHAAVRYSVITGSLALLNLMPITVTPFRDEYLDGRRETPYHIITKYKHTTDVNLMVRVANMLYEKKFTASMQDMDRCLAIDYVSEETQKPLYDVLVKVTWKNPQKSRTTKPMKDSDKPTNSGKPAYDNPSNVDGEKMNSSSMETQVKKNVDPQVLKEMGNAHFKERSFYKAMVMYSDAIDLQKSKMEAKYAESRDLAVLYGNRAECFLKLHQNDKALEDAVESVSYDGHWFKAHMKVGKAQAAKGNYELALQAYTNALNELSSEPSPQKAQREILASYCVHYMNVDKDKYPVDRKVTTFKVSTHMWALVTYDFISNGNWDIATFSYIQFKCDPTPNDVSELVNLKPMCELRMVQKCAWVMDLLEYFLSCGSDYNSMTTYPGDRYFHAAVKLTIVSGSFDLLHNILSSIVIPKNDQNMIDDKGNTALHIVTKSETDELTRVRIIVILLEAEANPLIRNKDGKYAIQYLPRSDGKAAEILHNVMKHQEDIEKRIKLQKLNQQRQQEALKKQAQTSSAATSTKQQGRQTQQNTRPQQNDSWKQTYMPKQQPTQPNRDRCAWCEKVLEESRTKINTKTTYAYNDMAKVIRENKNNHDRDKHQKIVDEMLAMITESVAKTLNPEIPERLAKIPWKCYKRIVNGLVSGENWRQLDAIIDEYRKHHGSLAFADYAKDIKLHRVIIHSSLKGSHQLLSKIILSMLKSGAVMENDGKKCVQAAVQEEQYKILETLFNQGACPSHLSVNTGDTPIHAALSIAIERDRGNFTVFNLFLQMFENDPEKYQMLDPCQQDKYGDCLFHLVAKVKYNSTVQKATELLCDKKIPSNVKNNEDKLPIHYLNIKNDRRLQFFRLASVGGPTKVTSKKPKLSSQQKKAKYSKEADQQDGNQEQEMAEENDLLQYTRAEDVPHREAKQTVKPPLRKEALRQRIEELIYGLDDVAYSKYSSRLEELEKTGKKPKPEKQQETQVTDHVVQDQEPVPEVDQDEADPESDEEEGVEEQFQFDPQVFENLEWEVECTADVWKALRDKHVLPELKQRIVRKIQHLAAGEWTTHLCKKLRHNIPETLRLFEAKITKGGRIIWELAIAFSPRLSESAERILECNDDQQMDRPVKGGKIYSEIIRVWDIVFDHGKIYSSVQRIIKSHTRGESCIIQKKLKGVKHEKYSDKTNRRFPRIYAEAEIDKSNLEEVMPYFPPASANDTEYHILKFYSFSSNLVSHILQNIEIKVDFPFRVTDLEHAIINLQSNAPILLLGRSGTGKTTCCLYRLWSRFLWYWTKAKEADAPLLPRCVIYRDQEENKDEEEEEEETETEEECKLVEEEIAAFERQISGGSSEGPSAALEEENEGQEEEVEIAEGQQYDHLHQIFITKNAVLCNEVQKNFRELMHACDVAKNHLEAETQNLPNRLQDVTEYQFPLFVTSRQLLLMLDASLDQPYFFDRAEDGSLKADIQGWTDGDGPLSILPLLQEGSDDEDESEEEVEETLEEDQENQVEGRKNRKKSDPRKEMTYELFSESIWPHMNKGVGKKYHPSLVWTEIMSFIKGSYEALSKPSGCLDQEEYIDLGRKRAPNFTGERRDIYTLFKRYEHARKQKFLFDETDLVRDVYHRLCKQQDMNWIIHQIFVDETQDFTQAELCLLLRLCQNPNEMFLTGDTAQSIMRGIAFRFSDLKSLFFYASKSLQAMGKTSGVAIPKQVYQLTHNYRSHAGILSLASSILDLMIEFFPESFDRLNKDQGLFHGPQPVILESCSFSDLALLLRGNKRKTSHIEFGAHQAILVVNDAARESVPEELQYGLILTIYEAKGLEFDDILLYNFFKDSQASKEWRVVTDFLERLYQTSKSGTDSLVKVSSEILQQKDRPRSLAFDPNQHKVLNSELKHLYTAVTRARVNVWIFDEDMEKRAPMFEYFKARHLVKAIVSEDVQNFSTGSMFAEESTPQEWIKRAQDFMKHNLYEVAAKCYRQGLEPYMEKVAMSHQRALKASRIKDNPAKMREEFLLAAEQYLEVNLPIYAAKCLQNARERDLLAHLYEKIGQLEKAAETYRKLRRPIESSACYERMGYFDKAIETLFEQELYDMAFDTLKRFKMQKKEFEEQGKQLPQHLKDHAPKRQHTEEQLAYMAAETYHANKNVGKMLASLNRLSNIQDRVEFLKKNHNQHNEYLKHAAGILRDNGKVLAAIRLYLDQGEVEEALSLARGQGRKDFIGYCLIVQARIEINIDEKGNATSDNEETVIGILKEAFDLFKNLDDRNCYKYEDSQNGAGEASLLLGQLKNDIEWINLSWGAFNKAKPRNEAGQLECMHWMMYNSDLSARQNLFQVVKGMKNLYGVLRVVILASTEDVHRLDHICRFYGLEKGSDDDFTYNPRQNPRILHVLKTQGAKINAKQLKTQISNQDARNGIALELLMKGKEWYFTLQLVFYTQHRKLDECPLFRIGLKNQCQTPCSEGQHSKLSYASFNELIKLDMLFIEMEYYVDEGCRAIDYDGGREKVMPEEHQQLQNSFYNWRDNEYSSCKLLLRSMLLRFRNTGGNPISVKSDVYYLKTVVGEKNVWLGNKKIFFVRNQIERMLGSSYDKIKDKANKIRENNTELFMNMIFLMNFFQIQGIPLEKILHEFEHNLQTEYVKGFIVHRKLVEMGLLFENDLIHCIFRRFMEAYKLLSSANNSPEYALREFSKFIQLIKRPNHVQMLPDLSLFTMWIEFFMVTAFCLECKFTTRQDVSFVIPSSYLSVVNFVDSSFLGEQGVPTLEAINRYNPFYTKEQDLIRNRIERLVGILAGSDSGISFVTIAFNRMSDALKSFQPWGGIDEDHPTDHFKYSEDMIDSIMVAERVLIASLVLLCNMEKTVYTDSETHVIGEICRIDIPSHCPERLVQAVQKVQNAKGIADVALCLKKLLEERGEILLHCTWEPRHKVRHGISPNTNINMSAFSQTFYLPHTAEIIKNPNIFVARHAHVDDEEMAMTTEEREKIEAEHQAIEEAEKRKRCANTLLKFFKHVQFLSNCQNLRELCEKEQNKERQSSERDIFKDVIVTENVCGICGEYFRAEERNIEREMEVQDTSTVTQFSPQPADVSGQPAAPESYSSIINKVFSNMKGYVLGTGTQQSVDSRQPTVEYSPPSHQNLLHENFPSLSETHAAILDGLTPLQKHERSLRHLEKQQDYKMFQNRYIREFKTDVEEMKKFIEKYELKSPRVKKLYPDFLLGIAHVTSAYDKVMEHITKIIETKDWRDNTLHQSVKEMMGIGNEVYQDVIDRYSKHSKVSAKNAPKHYTNDNDYGDDYYDELETVVPAPKTKMEFVNTKYKKKRGR